MGDIVGHRRIYVAGVVLFVLASAGCGLAWSLPSLVVARALQGLGGAAIMSVNTALIRFIAPPDRLGRAVGTNALVVGLSFTAGPSVASAILSVASWPWLFLVNVPVGVVALALALRTLPDTPRARHRFDAPAAALCALFFGVLVLAIGGFVQGADWHVVAAQAAVALAALAGLMWRQRAHPAPMLPADLFRRPVFALSSATSFCAFATQGLAFVSLPFLFQSVLGRSAVETGLLITPWPAVVALMAPIAGRLSDRYPAGALCGLGLAVLSLGMAAMALLPAQPGDLAITLRMLVCGAGFGFFQSPNLRALMSSAPARRAGGASGVVALSRLLGQTIGAALVALCLNLWHGAGPATALWLGVGFAATGSVMSLLRLVPRRAGQ